MDLKISNNLLCQIPENRDKVLAAISKYQNQPSIKTILEKCNIRFFLKAVSLTDVEKEMRSWDTKHPIHLIDDKHPIHLTKFLKPNVYFFSPFILRYVNKSVSLSTFPSIIKLADITPVYKKIHNTRKATIDLLESYQIYLKSLKRYCINKFPLFWKRFL